MWLISWWVVGEFENGQLVLSDDEELCGPESGWMNFGE